MKALLLTDPAVKMIRRMPELAGKRPIGRGVFSAVFDGTRPDTVLKLTVDSRSYGLSNDGCVRCDGPHFPRVVNNFGEVGESIIRQEEYPIYLYEVERLSKLQAGSVAAKQARALLNASIRASGRAPYSPRSEHTALSIATALVDEANDDETIPVSLHTALEDLRDWIGCHDDISIDLHRGNLMQDSAGVLVINDPICHDSLLRSLRPRGFW